MKMPQAKTTTKLQEWQRKKMRSAKLTMLIMMGPSKSRMLMKTMMTTKKRSNRGVLRGKEHQYNVMGIDNKFYAID